MILVDSSAWIELLRGTGHVVHRTLKHHLDAGSSLGTTEVVVMELLAGAGNERDRALLRERLLALPLLRLRGMPDFESAAELYRRCRRRGETVRKLIDCLIAAVAIRERATVLHNDRDFEVLVRHTPLRAEPSLPRR
jgi:predicted nucleic acid-binding protein